MADLQQLEDQIVSLSLLDAAALVKKLEERLGVSAAAAAPVAAAPAVETVAAAPETVAAEAEAAGTDEDSQTAAAATEPPVEG